MDDDQSDLFSDLSELDLTKWMIADLHDDLKNKMERFRYLTDLSGALGESGTMMPAGEITSVVWFEVRTSFIHGNYVATIVLCQGLAEHLLAANLTIGLHGIELKKRIKFNETLKLSLERGVIKDEDFSNLLKLMALRNPLSHYRDINDPEGLSSRMLSGRITVNDHLYSDAKFAIATTIRLLALPSFRLGSPANRSR